MNKKGYKHHHIKKKKLTPFYKITLSFAVIFSIVLLYFLVLVSNEPKSIPYVSNKVESYLKNRFGNDTTLGQTYVGFTKYGTIKIVSTNLNIIYQDEMTQKKQQFFVPQIESEFSLINLLFLKPYPSKLKIIGSKVVIDNSQESPANSESVNHVPLITKFLSSVRQGEFPIKFFEIENSTLLLKNQDATQEIFIKNSQIRNRWKGDELSIESSNIINFTKEKPNVIFNSNCQLSILDNLKCDLFLQNFVPDSITNIHPKLNLLSQIDTSVNLSGKLTAHRREILNFNFRAEAENGSFSFLDFFKEKISFKKFVVEGDYDHKIGILNLNNINVDFVSHEVNQQPQLNMSLIISGLKGQLMQKLDFYIKLKDVSFNEVEKFWPITLSHNNIRDWVTSHIKNGTIKNSYSKFSLLSDAKEVRLEQIDAQVIFDGLDLNYDLSFPEITDVSGVANFSKRGMNIFISNGNVLNSAIIDSTVAIEDFSAKKIMLKINGHSKGHAADSLKHASYQTEFAQAVTKYLNGDSDNKFEIALPLENTNLRDSYISVKSHITNLNNDYVKGEVDVVSTKDFLNNNFISNIDLKMAELKANELDIKKDQGIVSSLSFIVDVANPKNIAIKNILLLKNSSVQSNEKIYGDFSFNITPFKLISLNIKNDNFNGNNYIISYRNNNSQKLDIKGQKINLGAIVKSDIFKNSSAGNINNLRVQIALNNASLLNKKTLKSFYFSLNCSNNFCSDGLLNTFYGNGNSINLRMVKSNDNSAAITGNIGDIGYLADALGISNLVADGNAKVKLQNQLLANKQVLSGELVINSDITIYENDRVKKLEKDDLFSKIKDTIFSNNKTTFNSVKLDFELKNNVFNIKSLIANNYKVGITAKGSLDMKNNSYQINGMIVPGFIINNLFGIGKIPILGTVVSDLLTGGEGGGVFGIRYEYVKKAQDQEGKFNTYKVSAFVPTAIKDLFN